MPTNFDFLTTEPLFEPFAEAAVSAERVLPISPSLCATACRTALESAVKWVYRADKSLIEPYDDRLSTLINTDDFRDLVPSGMMIKLEYLRRIGNNATHNPKSVSRDQAMLALQNLHSFLDFVSYCYGSSYIDSPFKTSLLNEAASIQTSPQVKVPTDAVSPSEPPPSDLSSSGIDFAAKRTLRLKKGYTVKPTDMTEKQTRTAYIDVMLQDAGWQRDINWFDEFPIGDMPNKSGTGAADYVLMGDDNLPLAVVEAKRTSVNVEKGRQQAVLYADYLEKKYKRRPVIFMTNGYDTRIWNDRYYPERNVSGIYSKRDLEKEFNKMRDRISLRGVRVDDAITNRYYQKEAIQAVCDAFDARNRRKALLVMATGSGKTRTVISLVDVLIRSGWVKNVLFLADRKALVKQAKGAFHAHLPNLSLCNLCDDKEDAGARAIFSTYQTMINSIDDTRDDKGERLFTLGHFDLIIVDEAHRSIFNEYRDIFSYFDALLVGLTATPKDEVDKNTYSIFDMESGVPTYGYELAQAVQDGYLVDYVSVNTKLKFLSDGITYDDLSADEKELYEDTFTDEEGNLPEAIDSSAMNQWVFNEDTIRQALGVLMQFGQRVDYGEKIGKTIIFAKNHRHAEEILKVWNKEYADYPTDYAQVIDNTINHALDLIDKFSAKNRMPQIAISVDMLDTGIDVPEILNLVFFKKVFSRAKFWQMIGRGTRTYPGLIDGEDKKLFYIFDLCGNFDFFRLHTRGHEARAVATLQERMFNMRTGLVYTLQDMEFQDEVLQGYRQELVQDLAFQVRELPGDNYAVKQHLRVIDKYRKDEDFAILTYENTLQIAEHIAPLVLPKGRGGEDQPDVEAERFDMLIYQIEAAILAKKSCTRAKNDVKRKGAELFKLGTIQEVVAQRDLLERILHSDFLEGAGIGDYEEIRLKMRGLIKFIPDSERARYETDFTDDIVSMEWEQSQLDNDDLANYKKKVNFYISQNQQNVPAIARLKGNEPLSQDDVKVLEEILWNELGTKEQYETQYGQTPLGELVRSIVGVSQKAANDAFSRFLNDAGLDSRQMYFVRQIVNYIVKNGLMKDYSILQESPFTDMGSVSELFDTVVFLDLRRVIEGINRNALAA
ncbi:MAG: DEAD/DEAH box helicase family protein [Peptococcaceae bacterium]|nr:DEAD/DEAH box helicase family protein [Peptococcaceae bacterium]